MEYVLGVDAGGDQSTAVVVDCKGKVHGVGQAGGANFQICGLDEARRQVRLAVEESIRRAGAEPNALRAVCYGAAAAQRPKDFEIIRSFTENQTFCLTYRLENQAVIALRAGTSNGVGIALLAGSDSSSFGRNAEGVKLRLGGLGRLSGDVGTERTLVEAAVTAAILGQDRRGPLTSLTDKIVRRLGLSTIEDVAEFYFHDSEHRSFDLGTLAGLVFDAASENDAVANAILHECGERIAHAARVIANKLFTTQDRITVVLGGSLFRNQRSLALIDTVVQKCKEHRPNSRFVRLELHPVLGAVHLAFDDAKWSMTREVWKVLKSSFLRRSPVE